MLASKGDNSTEKLHNPTLASSIAYITDWELPFLVISLRGSLYYYFKFINNIWYKYTGITKQKDKCMTDKKLWIHREVPNWRLQTPLALTWTQMLRISLQFELHWYHFMGKGAGAITLPTLKIECGKTNLPLPPFFSALNLRKNFFYFIMEAYILSS